MICKTFEFAFKANAVVQKSTQDCEGAQQYEELRARPWSHQQAVLKFLWHIDSNILSEKKLRLTFVELASHLCRACNVLPELEHFKLAFYK